MTQGGMQQEMLQREQPQAQQAQEQAPVVTPETELKFGGGGGGGKPYVRFGSVSSFSSTVCRPDPENPGQQICKKVHQETVIDPETGKRSVRNIEKEEQMAGGMGSFFGGGPAQGPGLFGFLRDHLAGAHEVQDLQNWQSGARQHQAQSPQSAGDQNQQSPPGQPLSALDIVKMKGQQALNRMKGRATFDVEQAHRQPEPAPVANQPPLQQPMNSHTQHQQQAQMRQQDEFEQFVNQIENGFFGGPSPMQRPGGFAESGNYGQMGGPSPMFGGMRGHQGMDGHSRQGFMDSDSMFDQMEREFFGQGPFASQGGFGPGGMMGGMMGGMTGHPQHHPGHSQQEFSSGPFQSRSYTYSHNSDSQPQYFQQQQFPNHQYQQQQQQQPPQQQRVASNQSFLNSDDPRDVFRRKNGQGTKE